MRPTGESCISRISDVLTSRNPVARKNPNRIPAQVRIERKRPVIVKNSYDIRGRSIAGLVQATSVVIRCDRDHYAAAGGEHRGRGARQPETGP